ncbi:6,7-dimethyl-8-ribityllumazine synthase [Lentilactobacillus senioris DSM 24302 = JCM 17472]|uniref:6,7-dimethyl-8-ribityllumazine synthase n=1 Tax=Lentilactobacillus senioris DSM 24302 = JCM 17472 TaxID=1423802 RepID=A0A0R2CRF0_9LACO|nr:6,7-dimethyl-8-ribityllumazine synthase [Lentilactobacillus senioris]KRM93712.1 6,7-dimethyl-8-ribityllumazine synthase [Lentilactobacillus senioris DSM 24302 = JCM 17472]
MNNQQTLTQKSTAKIGIVVADFNEIVTSRLLEGTLSELNHLGIQTKDIKVVHVPGAFELPRAAKRLMETELFDGIIALGAVIRGETSHYDYVCAETAKGLAELSLQGANPVMFGVLTTDNIEQALNRSGGKGGNKGRDCAQGVLQMINLDRRDFS